jgi:hypothetical protein
MLGVFKICSFRLADAHRDVKNCVHIADGEREWKKRRHERKGKLHWFFSRRRVYVDWIH